MSPIPATVRVRSPGHWWVAGGVAAVGIAAIALLYINMLVLFAIAFCVVAAVVARYSSTLAGLVAVMLLTAQIAAAVVVKVDDLDGQNFLFAFVLVVVPSIVLTPGLLLGSARRVRKEPADRLHGIVTAVLAGIALTTSTIATLILFGLR